MDVRFINAARIEIVGVIPYQREAYCFDYSKEKSNQEELMVSHSSEDQLCTHDPYSAIQWQTTVYQTKARRHVAQVQMRI